MALPDDALTASSRPHGLEEEALEAIPVPLLPFVCEYDHRNLGIHLAEPARDGLKRL